MSFGHRISFALVLAACGSSTPTISNATNTPEVHAVRAKTLLDKRPANGTEVVVDLYEPLYDSAHSSGAGPGQYDVEVEDVGPKRFVLVAAQSVADREAGALASLPEDLHPPVRVRGVIADHRDGDSIRLVAHAIERLELPRAEKLASIDVLADRPERWSGKLVEVEADYFVGFEASLLGGDTWLGYYPDADVRCAPSPSQSGKGGHATNRVRVTGFAYTTGRYGHLGMRHHQIVATRVVYLDPSRPECR